MISRKSTHTPGHVGEVPDDGQAGDGGSQLGWQADENDRSTDQHQEETTPMPPP